MNKLLTGLCVAAALVGISNVAAAADDGFYAGAGIGQSFTTITFAGAGSSTYTDTAYKLLGGYAVNKNFAVEAEYINLGTFKGSVVNAAATGYGMSAVGTLPVAESFSLYGKVGFSSVTTTLSVSPGFVLLVPASQSKSGVSFGLGGQFNVSQNAAIRLSLDSYQYAAGGNALVGRAGVYGVSGVFKF
jgi:OOP family OmpA-OmpF porin